VLAIVEVGLMIRYAKAGPPELVTPDDSDDSEQRLAFAY
jgi:cytochrome d ubiquinol oxidase subunit I